MNNYTVLLMRGDGSTYLAHLSANGAADAIDLAQREAAVEDGGGEDDDDPIDPTEYGVLFCCIGHQEDLAFALP